MTNPAPFADLAAIADRVGRAKHHAVVSKREGIQAVKDREVLMTELMRLRDAELARLQDDRRNNFALDVINQQIRQSRGPR